MNHSVRKGTFEDLEDVLRLIVELAVFEKAQDEVVLDIQELERDYRANNFEFFIAEREQKIVGMAFFYQRYSTWKGPYIHLEDLIVSESERGNGIGKALFKQVVKECQKRNMRKMQWQVLDWNKPAIDFYKKYDAHFNEEWIDCVLTENQINLISR